MITTLLTGAAGGAEAGRLPPGTDFSGVGIAVHLSEFAGSEADARQLEDAGIRIVRADLFWDATERVKGRYNWAFYDTKLRLLAARGIRPLLILDYSNPLYTEDRNTHVPPRTSEEIEAFGDWAAEAAKHFEPLNPIWEIWNEPDIPQFWAPQPKVEEYLALADATCAAIRTAVPDATVIGPALAIAPREDNINSQVFLRLVLRDTPLMQCLDAISMHPYRDTMPETLLDDLPFYRELMETEAGSRGTSLPFVSSEWGYSTHTGTSGQKVLPDTQANYVVRQQFVALLAGFPLMIDYNWRNRRDKPEDREANYGVLTTDLKPKPAYNALVQLKLQLGGFQFLRPLVQQDGAFVLAFQSDGGAVKLAAWKVKGSASLVVTSASPIAAVSIYGDKVDVESNGSGYAVQIDDSPTYIDVGDAIPQVSIE